MAIHKKTWGILVAIATAAVFGFYPPAARAAYADGVNPVFIILFTTFWRASSLALFCLGTRKPFFQSKKNIKFALINSVFQTASTIGILGGMQFLQGPVVITIVFSSTMMLYFFLVLSKQERLTWTTLTPMIAAFVGLSFVVNVYDKLDNFSLLGILLSFMAAIATVFRVYNYGKILKENNPMVIGAETFLFTLLLSCLLFLYQTPALPQSEEGWIWAGICAASLSLGSFGMFYGIALLGAFKFSLFSKLEPVLGAVFSVLLIGEILLVSQYVGMVIVISSLVAYQILQHRPLPPTASNTAP